MRKRDLLKAVCILFVTLAMITSSTTTYASVVSERLKEVQKVYPNKSRINQTVDAYYVHSSKGLRLSHNNGCNALVTYTTMKIFQNPYEPDSKTYSKVGSASTTKKKSLKKLFKKAKEGDVVRWYTGKNNKHFAIFLSYNSKGIYVYEANFNTKNKVYSKHLWKWSKMKSWAGTAKTVGVYRSNNYAQVNQKKAAKRLQKGDQIEVNGVIYEITKNSISGGKVKVVKTTNGKEKKTYPKAIGVNYTTAKNLSKYGYQAYADYIWTRTYSKLPNKIQDEQYFTICR